MYTKCFLKLNPQNQMETLTYDRVADQKRLAFIVKNIESSVPKRGFVLDVGCGNGIISCALGQYGYQVRGIDVSEKAIQTARQYNQLANVKFEVTEAEALMASDVVYDAIVCSEVLEHLENPAILLQTLHHLLKDNGILIVTVPNGQGPREMMVTRPTLKLRKEKGKMWKALVKMKSLLKYKGTTVQSDADHLDHVQFFSKHAIYQLSNQGKFAVNTLESTNFMEDVFPFSLLTRRFVFLQKLDCWIADQLPPALTGGFLMIWTKEP